MKSGEAIACHNPKQLFSTDVEINYALPRTPRRRSTAKSLHLFHVYVFCQKFIKTILVYVFPLNYLVAKTPRITVHLWFFNSLMYCT
ncbi:hypothetical protein H6G81_10710 [Scytonema hofmannii FACHB-248]|uniref:Uncharacterized protein n=1 Tax=Scytonema hofmannii FACHB-248 TaxID=1842502 RepID=A0ABR8GP99_9CYAN|nr:MULTISPECIES: hypothetical protein [Nostocales]MBD2604988.1 hypothetical protein [Scytonema hofmannii FACHB-248]